MEEQQNEIYKIIYEFENYEISNLGKVRNRLTGRILKPLLSNTGYYRVNLYNPNNSKKILIHQLVAKYFLEKNENENIIQHIDKNLLNNCENNLRYVSKRGQNTTVMNNTQQKNNENKDCKVGEFSQFGACSATCGGGTQTRTRTVTQQPTSGGKVDIAG